MWTDTTNLFQPAMVLHKRSMPSLLDKYFDRVCTLTPISSGTCLTDYGIQVMRGCQAVYFAPVMANAHLFL